MFVTIIDEHPNMTSQKLGVGSGRHQKNRVETLRGLKNLNRPISETTGLCIWSNVNLMTIPNLQWEEMVGGETRRNFFESSFPISRSKAKPEIEISNSTVGSTNSS